MAELSRVFLARFAELSSRSRPCCCYSQPEVREEEEEEEVEEEVEVEVEVKELSGFVFEKEMLSFVARSNRQSAEYVTSSFPSTLVLAVIFGGLLSDETLLRLAEKVSGEAISLEDLSPEEQCRFKRAVAAGVVSSLIEPWTPWWVNVARTAVAIGPRGTSMIREVDDSQQPGVEKRRGGPFEPAEGDEGRARIPPPSSEELPPMKELTKAPPSPLLGVHLVNITYSYCFVMRLYNGEWSGDLPGVSAALLDLSSVLKGASTLPSIRIALEESMRTACTPLYKDAGGPELAVAVMSDVVQLLRAGRGAVVRMLADVTRILKASNEAASAVGPELADGETGDRARMGARAARNSTAGIRDWRGRRRRKSSGRRGGESVGKLLRAAEKKAYFFTVWGNEQTDEAFEILAESVEEEWKSQQLHRVDPRSPAVGADRAGGTGVPNVFKGLERKSAGAGLDGRAIQNPHHPLIEEMN
ncbi:hypothetical protein CBR_g20449 [Chara braunii]|uniref:Shq1 C-terminal domain-containing protein n=1 Tax=Chara braunii TaxID=69332 RepID=A0A388JUD9_CHABU|nr:hypothetical protein CBR_g20449 [Chara braunii]|eukprot:GBG61418.1 hypothetical protein CBR_g20449 [Chara braunii]